MKQSQHALRGELPIILIAAVLQGWALYGLHMAVKGNHWPATDPGWLLGLYAAAAIVPLTVQRLSPFMRQRAAWVIIGATAALLLYFGWHHGAHVTDLSPQRFDFAEQWVPFGFVLTVLWLLTLPFVQVRLDRGRWRVVYADLFSHAWNNKLVLIEAGLFTGLFWLLLLLWQQLFVLLGMHFFRELFSEPLFVYPVTSLVFGVALHLIGSLQRFTSVVLEQVLSVLKWLALLAGLILTLFTTTLITKLPGMIGTGERVISAAWLLWLVAVMVLLVNAAYRDGSVERPYPRPIALALRFVVPLTIVVSLTALYALSVRIERFGFTVDRVWACVVAVAAFIYSVGYAWAARDREQWMAGIARVNVIVALLLIGTLALALTPVLSPYRIAAASQFAHVLERASADTEHGLENAILYLRFSSGAYGVKRLRQLAQLQDHPNAAAIRADAQDALAKKFRYEIAPSKVENRLANVIVHPKSRALEPGLVAALKTELGKSEVLWRYASVTQPLSGVFIDMDGNGSEEFVLIAQQHAAVFEQREAAWSLAARLASTPAQVGRRATALGGRDIHAVRPKWSHLQVGQQTFREESSIP